MILFGSDFDGTIWNGSYRKEDLDAVAEFRRRGSRFGICTGRPWTSFRDADRNELRCDFVCGVSGGCITDENNAIIRDRVICYETAMRLHEALREAGWFYFVSDQGYSAFQKKPETSLVVRVSDTMDHLKNERIHGVSVDCPDETTALRYAENVRKKFDEVSVFVNRHSIDIAAAGVSKGESLRFLKEYWGAAGIAAMGDSWNDIDMLEAADISFTFEYAPPEVQACAGHIVGSVEEALQYLFDKYL